MQPPRPYRGASYDKNMFTFLSAPSSRDVLSESSKKRKLVSTDYQIVVPPPSHRESTPAFPFMESLNSREYSHEGRDWDQHNCVALSDSNKTNFYGTRSEYSESSFSRQLQSPSHNNSLSSFHMSEVQERTSRWASSVIEDPKQHVDCESNTLVSRVDDMANYQEFRNRAPHKPVQMKAIASVSHEQALRESENLLQPILDSGKLVMGSDGKGGQGHETLARLPSVTKDFNQLEHHQSNAQLARGQSASHFQEFGNFVMEKSVQMKIAASGPIQQASKLDSQCFEQQFLNLAASFLGSDGRSIEKTYKFDSSLNVKQGVDACTSAGCDSTRFSGNNVGNSLYNLQCETNDFLQNALRLLSASSGINIADNACKIQENEDDVKMMKPMLDSVSQIGNQTQNETTLSKGETCLNLDQCCPKGDKDFVIIDQEDKTENGPSSPTDKLWDGTLQLSSSVSVSAIAFFKSGEKMQDFGWSESVEIKGKVRLEAFEKYVQDLPRSRTRGLMVMSLRLKEGSSGSESKGMNEVARKYKDGKKVGFAQPSSGVDMYICPNSDTIITILAKYGFFKGISAALDKSDPLLGCVVWRKNNSSVTNTTITKINDPQSRPSLSSPSNTHTIEVAKENSALPIKSQDLIISSTEKVQLTESGETSRDKSPGLTVDQTKLPTVDQNTLVLSSDTDTQVSGLKTNGEFDKPSLILPSVALKQPEVTSDDDDDLPEFDFRAAISKTVSTKSIESSPVESRLTTEQLHMPAQMKTEGMNVSDGPPNSRFQPQVTQSIGNQSQSHVLKVPTDPRKNISEKTTKPKLPDFQAVVPNNKGHQLEKKAPSLPLQQPTQIGKIAPNTKPRNLFDDDDMPEWRPPDFTKPRQELARWPAQPIVSSNAIAPKSGFRGLVSSNQPPLPPTHPPLTQSRFQHMQNYSSAPHPPRVSDNKPAATAVTNKGVDVPPGFAPNSAFRPQFNPPDRKKPNHPASWRGGLE